MVYYIIPSKIDDPLKSSVSSLEHFIVKPLDNLLSYDENKVWLSNRRGELRV